MKPILTEVLFTKACKFLGERFSINFLNTVSGGSLLCQLNTEMNVSFQSSSNYSNASFISFLSMPLVALLSVTNLLSIILNLSVIFIQITRHSFENGIRIGLVNWSICFVISNTFLIVKTVFFLLSIRSSTAHSKSSYECWMEDLAIAAIIIGYFSYLLTIAAITIDRLLAITWYTSYWKFGPKLAMIMNFFTWPLAVALYSVQLLLPFSLPKSNFCFSAVAGNSIYSGLAISISVILHVMIIISFVLLVKRNNIVSANCFKFKGNRSILGWLQVRKNIATMRVILPSIILGTSIGILVEALKISVLILCKTVNNLTLAFYLETMAYVIVSLQSVIHPLVLVSKKERKLCEFLLCFSFQVIITIF